MNSDSLSVGSRWKWGSLAVLAIILLVAWRPGCRYYPEVTSVEGMQLIKLLYAASNTQDLKRLELAEEQLKELVRDNKVSAREKKAFESIISLARSGSWKEAEQASFRFAEDQIGRGHPASKETKQHGPGEHSH